MAFTSPPWVKLLLKNGRTFSYLRSKYPLTGVGFFTELLILLSNTPGHHLDFNNPVDKNYMVRQMNVSEKVIAKMLPELVTCGKLDKDLWEQCRVIFMPDCVEGLNEYYRRKREGPGPPELAELHEKHLPSTCRQHDGSSRVEEKRREEIRGVGGKFPSMPWKMTENKEKK